MTIKTGKNEVVVRTEFVMSANWSSG